MKKIVATRTELLARRRQILLATQGRNLLEQKRSALLTEFMKMANELLDNVSELEEQSAQARTALARAEAFAGVEAVRSAALINRHELEFEVEVAVVWGLRVPSIEKRHVTRHLLDRGYALSGTSVFIDEAAESYEDFIDAIIQLAEHELRLSLLADEIGTLTRRINSLDNILIPRLAEEQKEIQLVLEERERSKHFQLKRVKTRIHQEH